MIKSISGIITSAKPDIVRTNLVLQLNSYVTSSISGSNWYDISGNNNHFVANTGIIGYNGGVWDFSGTTAQGQYMEHSLAGSVVQRTGSFSVSICLKHPATFGGGEQLFSNAVGADGFRIGFYPPGVMYYLISGAGGTGYQEAAGGGTNIGDGNWHMLTWVFDRAAQNGSYVVQHYQAATLVNSSTISSGASGNVAFTNNSVSMGYKYCCALFKGQISNILAYNKALTAAEIIKNYNALKTSHSLT